MLGQSGTVLGPSRSLIFAPRAVQLSVDATWKSVDIPPGSQWLDLASSFPGGGIESVPSGSGPLSELSLRWGFAGGNA